jgi:hypothetical protein
LFGLELLTTVHWLLAREGASSRKDLIAGTYRWGEQKKQFGEYQILNAYRALYKQGWLEEALR